MKIFAAVSLTLLVAFRAVTSDELIQWKPDVKLTWADFKDKKHVVAGGMDAYTAYMITLTPENNGATDSLTVNVICSFDKNKSTVKPGKQTDGLLKHEQGHFDIAEIYARMLRKKYAESKISMTNAQNFLNTTYKNNFSALETEQNNYDSETNHSMVEAQQEKWNKKIEERLKSLEKFSGTMVKIKLLK